MKGSTPQQFLLGCSLLLSTFSLHAATIYVDSAAAGNADGSNWANAFNTITQAITAAAAGDEIWVKGGTYTLTTSLIINKDISLHGGFAGTEATRADRVKSDRGGNGVTEIWEYTNATVLDGNNTVRVVDFSGSSTATIEGFTIQNGTVTGNGGGILATSGATVLNCEITGNRSNVSANNDGGGGISISGANTLIRGNFIYNNYAAKEAGGLHVLGGGGTIQNNLIINNETPGGRFSAGVYLNPGSNTAFEHNIVANNKGGSSNSAGLRVENAGFVTITNSVIWSNVRATGATNNTENRGTFNNTAIEAATYGTAGISLNAANDNAAGPNFRLPTNFDGQPDGTTHTINDVTSSDWRINLVSPLLEAGSSALIPTLDIDVLNDQRKRSVDFSPNTGTADIGPYEYVFETPIAPNIIDSSNNALQFNWAVIGGVAATDGYTYQVDTVDTFDSPALITATSTTNSTTVNNLLAGQIYYVRFRAENDGAMLITEWSNFASDTVTPVLGLDLEIHEETLSWTVDSEIGVKSYLVQQLIKGHWLTVEELAAGADHYETTIDPDFQVQLVVVDHNGFAQSFLPNLAGKAQFSYQLNAGWNLISLPLADADLSSLYAVIEGQPMLWLNGQYQPTQSINPGDAFFVYTDTDATVSISGTKCTLIPTLTKGWNLIGVTENQPLPANVNAVYTLNSIYQSVLDQNLLIQGTGYWIHRN